MIASMTGFGRAEYKEEELEVVVEIRSLNHRFLEVEVRGPKSVLAFEQDIKELVRSRVSRGRISATIVLKGEPEAAVALTLDKPLAATYVRLLRELKDDLGINGEVGLQQLLSFPEIFTVESTKPSDDQAWRCIRKTVERALDDLIDMRLREGEEIKKDLVARVNAIDEMVRRIEAHSQAKSQEVFQKLKQRVHELVSGETLDDGRLEMEVALLAERVDVTEECIRFKSHNTLFRELLEKETSEGRKLNFLLQEMHREANTIGAKASDSQIAHWVVEIKEEVEKLREQIQNIE